MINHKYFISENCFHIDGGVFFPINVHYYIKTNIREKRNYGNAFVIN